MTREEKAQVIDELSVKFSQHAHFYLTDASGLTVEQINAFRKLCFKAGVEYRVYKNTLIRKALEKNGTEKVDEIAKILHGFSGVIFSKEAANAPAKVIQEYRKKMVGRPYFKAAYIDSDLFVGEENLKTLAELKSKNELVGEVIALLQSPAKNVLSALLSGKHTVAGLVKALEGRAK
jgi:large subunit ribosomal protein L10